MLAGLRVQARRAKDTLVSPLEGRRDNFPLVVERARKEAKARGWHEMDISCEKAIMGRYMLTTKHTAHPEDGVTVVASWSSYDGEWLFYEDKRLVTELSLASNYDMNIKTSSQLAFWCWQLIGGEVPTRFHCVYSRDDEAIRDMFISTVATIRKAFPDLTKAEFFDLIKSNTFPDMTDADFVERMEFVPSIEL